MTTLFISKPVQKFLASALSADPMRPWLHHYLVTDLDCIIASDGNRMHVWPEKHGATPGYYRWDKERSLLARVDDSEVEKQKAYLAERLFYPQIYGKAVHTDPLRIYGAINGTIGPFRLGEYPEAKRVGTTMYFRKAKDAYTPDLYCLCLGINTLPFAWLDNGEVVIGNVGEGIRLDTLFVMQALSSSLVAPVMRFDDTNRPAIIGQLDGAHAILMPYGNGRR